MIRHVKLSFGGLHYDITYVAKLLSSAYVQGANNCVCALLVQVSVDYRQASGLQFLVDVYEARIPENAVEIRNVTVVQTIGQALNEHLAFTLLNSKGLFQIKSTSGIVQTTGRPFDRETRSGYVLVVEVRDERSPVRIAHCLVNITILDVNDYVPVFLNQPYFVIVPVGTKAGEVIKTVFVPTVIIVS